MASKPVVWSLFLLSLLSASFPLNEGASKKTAPANKSDVKFIRCEVCELMVKNLVKETKKQRESTAPKKLSEYSIIEIVEKICDPDRPEGEWVAKQDIVEDGKRLKLVEQDTIGECGTECRTIARACEEVLGDSDTDIAEALYKEETKRAQLSKLLCYQLSDACKRKPPPVPEDRPVGEAFKAKDDKELEVERLMQSMQGMDGMGGMEMFKRDEMMKKMGMGGADEDDDDDDDDDFTSPMKEHFAEDDAKNGVEFGKTKKTKAAPSGSSLTDSAKDVLDTATLKAKEALGSAVEAGKSAAGALSKQAQQAAEVLGEQAGKVGGYINDWVSSFGGKAGEKDGVKSAEL